MECPIFIPLRITFVVVSLVLSLGAIVLVLWNNLHKKKKPMMYMLHILCCQCIMALCAIAFASVRASYNGDSFE
jgi:uncharacterized membrane protein